MIRKSRLCGFCRVARYRRLQSLSRHKKKNEISNRIRMEPQQLR